MFWKGGTRVERQSLTRANKNSIAKILSLKIFSNDNSNHIRWRENRIFFFRKIHTLDTLYRKEYTLPARYMYIVFFKFPNFRNACPTKIENAACFNKVFGIEAWVTLRDTRSYNFYSQFSLASTITPVNNCAGISRSDAFICGSLSPD